jgi:hypothetical protein
LDVRDAYDVAVVVPDTNDYETSGLALEQVPARTVSSRLPRLLTRAVGERYLDLEPRLRGADIVQEGQMPDGAMLRWRFTEITPNSFHWLGERSTDNGASWWLQVEVFARRAKEVAADRRVPDQ